MRFQRKRLTNSEAPREARIQRSFESSETGTTRRVTLECLFDSHITFVGSSDRPQPGTKPTFGVGRVQC